MKSKQLIKTFLKHVPEPSPFVVELDGQKSFMEVRTAYTLYVLFLLSTVVGFVRFKPFTNLSLCNTEK
jgi:hypothetical protein